MSGVRRVHSKVMKTPILLCVFAALAVSQAANIPREHDVSSSDEDVLELLKEVNNLLTKGRLAPIDRSKRQVTTPRAPIDYDVEIDKVLSNERLVEHYFKCLVDDKYRCRGDGLKLKKRLPQYLREGLEKDFDSKEVRKECKDSSCAAEKKALIKLTRYFIEKKPEMWKKVEAKYDPTGAYKKKYYEKYGADLQANGVTIPGEFASGISTTTQRLPTPLP